MKANFLVILLLATTLFSCTKKSDDPAADVDITTGTWRISYYWDEKDETSDFSSYYFMFLNGGTLMAHNNTGAITGTWSVSGNRLIINMTDPFLSELNDDWLIIEKTTSSIKLKDDNPAQDDKLYFTKN